MVYISDLNIDLDLDMVYLNSYWLICEHCFVGCHGICLRSEGELCRLGLASKPSWVRVSGWGPSVSA